MPGFGRRLLTVLAAYLEGWWEEHKKLVKALADDVLIYLCYFIFILLMEGLLSLFRAGPEHEVLHKWAFLAIDAVLVFGLIRKVAILVLRD